MTDAAFLGALVAQLPEALIVIDENGLVVEWSRSSEELLQYARHEACGRLLSELMLPPELRDAHEHGMERMRKSQHGPVLGKRMTLPAIRKDGVRIHVAIRITRVNVEGRHVYAAVLHDAAEASPTPGAGREPAPIPGAPIPDAVVEDDLLDLVYPFIERQFAEMDRALALVGAGEFEEVKHIGHRLKGTAGSFGLMHVASLGEAIEDAARARDLDGVRAAVTEAVRVMRRARFVAKSKASR